MGSKNTRFFALYDDLLDVLVTACEAIEFKFAQGLDDERLPIVFSGPEDVPRLSEAVCGDQNFEARYLLIPEKGTPVPRPVVMNDGRVKNFLDQLNQPDSVALVPGGLYLSGKCVIAGSISTMTADEWSLELYKILRKAISKKFKKINGIFVGLHACERFKEGFRLTSSMKPPLFTDLSEQ